jgi:hypothetical protein
MYLYCSVSGADDSPPLRLIFSYVALHIRPRLLLAFSNNQGQFSEAFPCITVDILLTAALIELI